MKKCIVIDRSIKIHSINDPTYFIPFEKGEFLGFCSIFEGHCLDKKSFYGVQVIVNGIIKRFKTSQIEFVDEYPEKITGQTILP